MVAMSAIVFQLQPSSLSHHHHHHHLNLTLLTDAKPCSISTNSAKSFCFSDLQLGLSASSHSKFLPHASSTFVPGSEEPWLDSKPQQKKKNKIAGVDQDELLDPKLLADPDSCFCEFKGVHIHYKLYSAESQTNDGLSASASNMIGAAPPIILLHGFGASVYSWSRAMKRLAEVTASKVLAFDRPAFGLTSRFHSSQDSKQLNPYSIAFSVLATLYFIDFLAADKAILVGHSAGSLVAVNTYFEAPEHIAALILVAPAILAPRAVKRNKAGKNTETEGDRSDSNMSTRQFVKLLEILSKLAARITGAIIKMLSGMMDMLQTFYKKALSTILCSSFGVMLIRMVIDKFGIAAVRNAWYDANQVTEHVLDGYTKPLRAKGWDAALAEFTAATFANSGSKSKLPLSERLHEISCPVLIITGDSDRIVPSWNAKRLSQAIPGSCLEVIKRCGHLPHEEKVEEFVSVVEMFLQRVFRTSKEPSSQVAI